MDLIDGIIGAVIGGAIGAVVSLVIFQRQKKADQKLAAQQQTADQELAAKQQRNDIARAAHILIVKFQSEVLKVALDSAVVYNDSNVTSRVKQGVTNLVKSLNNEKGIVPQLDQCCPTQKIRLSILKQMR